MVYKKRLSEESVQRLHDIYYSLGESGGFGSVENVFKRFQNLYPDIPISKTSVQDFLNHQTTYTLHRRKINKFKRNMVFTPRCNYQWSLDLGDMNGFETYNAGFRYFLMACDTLTRYIYTTPLKSKSAADVSKGLEEVFKKADTLPAVINADSGTEFCNNVVQNLLKRNKIRFFRSYGIVKASHAEISIKSIKNLIYKYFDYTLTRKWVGILQKATQTHNTTYHSAIKMTPETANTFPQTVMLSEQTLHRAVKQVRHRKVPMLQEGDAVRISLDIAFKKGYEGQWSRAVYLIAKPPYYTIGGKYPMYAVKEQNGDIILGGFYSHQLLKLSKRTFIDEYEFPIERIVKRSGRNVLCKFLGYSDSYNLWLPSKQVKNILQS